jgi:S1-C subfamily serine protease
MRRDFATPLAAAVLGGALTAAALLGTGTVDAGGTRAVQGLIGAGPAGGRTTVRDVYRRDAPGVVFVRARALAGTASPFDSGASSTEEDDVSTGSGFVIDDDGHVCTNAHVVAGATEVRVTVSGDRSVPAKVIGKDLSTDVALLKIDPDGLDLRALELGDSDTVEVGDPTIAIGNPYGLDRTLTTGVISAKQRRITAPDGFSIKDVIQTDAALNPGNSGGPLLDARGRVIGMNSQLAVREGAGIGFAVPINTVEKVVEELRETGRVRHAYLGVRGRTIDDALGGVALPARSGVLVEKVEAGSPAARAGLKGGKVPSGAENGIALGGDVIVEVDGTEVASSGQLAAVVEDHDPGDEVEVKVVRDDGTKTLEVRLEQRPG